MDGSRGTIGLMVTLTLVACGCTSPPWSAPWGNRGPEGSLVAAQAGAPSGAPVSPDPTQTARTSQSTGAVPEAQELHALMAELQQLGALDPDAQRQLMEDLRRSDPAMWKPLMERFRASLAYRRRSDHSSAASHDRQTDAPEQRPEDDRSVESAAADEEPDEPRRLDPPPARTKPGQRRSSLAGRSPLAQESRSAKDRLTNQDGQADSAGKDREKQEKKEGGTESRRDRDETDTEKGAEDARHSGKRDGEVVQAAYVAGGEGAWQQRLAATIRSLEGDVSQSPKTEAEVARHVYLRLLYLAAGRRDDAMKPIPSVPAATQDFWATEIYGLDAWLNAERAKDPRDRAAESKRLLGEAAMKLGGSCPLVLRGLAFCTEVQSYGCYTKFEKDEFLPEQEVLLYAEIDNFRSEPTPKGFHTSLRTSYKILDSRGQQVAEQDFPVTEETCRSERHDFFIGYHLRMPKRIYVGKHTLKLTIEDLKRGEIGQASIDFAIKAAKD
jgi:hypothetical protein